MNFGWRERGQWATWMIEHTKAIASASNSLGIWREWRPQWAECHLDSQLIVAASRLASPSAKDAAREPTSSTRDVARDEQAEGDKSRGLRVEHSNWRPGERARPLQRRETDERALIPQTNPRRHFACATNSPPPRPLQTSGLAPPPPLLGRIGEPGARFQFSGLAHDEMCPALIC